MTNDVSSETQAALRRVDLYAAGVCRDLGLDVPKEWHLTYGELSERMATATEAMGRSVEAFVRAWTKAFGRATAHRVDQR